jgi:predicted DNA-binding transcriptional regulator AlpA
VSISKRNESPKRASEQSGSRAFLSAAELCVRWGISRITLWSWWSERKILPPPVRLGPHTARWALETVIEFERQRAARSEAA